MLADTLSCLFLAAVCLAPVVAIGVDLGRSRFNPAQYLFWNIARLLSRFLWGGCSPGKFLVPDNQGAILVCNHRSSVDPFFLQGALHRKVHWMVASEYVKHPAFGWFLRACEVIPVNRGGIDIAATKMALRLASQGGLVGMFPEGRINRSQELLLPGRPGAAVVALKAKAAIVPCYVAGSPFGGTAWSPFFMTAKTRVYFGKPLDLSEFAGREDEEGVPEEITLRALRAIAALAGERDFQPQIAGRNWKPTGEQLAADEAAVKKRRRR